MGGVLRRGAPWPAGDRAMWQLERPGFARLLDGIWGGVGFGMRALLLARRRLLPSPRYLFPFPVLTSGSAEGSLQKAEKVLKKVLEWNKEEVPNKDELVGNLYSCIGNAQIELGQMVAALQSHRKDLEIAKE